MTAYDVARRRLLEAIAHRDRLEAEWWLGELKRIVAEEEDAAIAEAVRDVELYAMAQTIQWRWIQ